MSDTGWRTVGAATGIGFVLLLVLAYILGPTDPPAFNEGPGATAAYVADKENAIDASAALLAGALVLFAFFIGAIAGNSRLFDRDGRLTAAGHAGGIAALVLSGGGVIMTSSSSAASASGADATVVQALFNTGAGAFAGAMLGAAVLVAATGLIAMRFGSLPSVYGLVSVVLAVAIAAVVIIGSTVRDGAFNPYDGVLPQIMLLLFVVWVLATSALLIGRAGKVGRRR